MTAKFKGFAQADRKLSSLARDGAAKMFKATEDLAERTKDISVELAPKSNGIESGRIRRGEESLADSADVKPNGLGSWLVEYDVEHARPVHKGVAGDATSVNYAVGQAGFLQLAYDQARAEARQFLARRLRRIFRR